MTKLTKQDNSFIYIDEQNNRLAEITFIVLDDSAINVNHTYVSPTLRGKGIGQQLVDAVVAYARENQLKIVPTCSYVKRLFDESDEYMDVYRQEENE